MLKIIFPCVLIILLSTTSHCQTTKDAGDSKIEIDGKIFEKVEREAEFPGGRNAWIEYLQNNLNSDVPIKKKAPAGTYQVIVKFIVSKSGKIKGITSETNHGYGMEKEVIRIIRKGPDWVPAMQDGHPVNAYRRQPVTFMISEE